MGPSVWPLILSLPLPLSLTSTSSSGEASTIYSTILRKALQSPFTNLSQSQPTLDIKALTTFDAWSLPGLFGWCSTPTLSTSTTPASAAASNIMTSTPSTSTSTLLLCHDHTIGPGPFSFLSFFILPLFPFHPSLYYLCSNP